jgi:hypothetical protein
LAKNGKNQPKIEFFDFFEKVSFFYCIRWDVFPDLKNVKIAGQKIGQFLPILDTVYEFK